MRKMMMAAVALLGIVVAGPAMAQCHLGLNAAASMANMDLGVTGTPLALDGLGAQSTRPDFGAHAGCDFKVASSPLVVGVFGDWMNQEVQFAVQPDLLTVSLGNSWTVGGRLGYQMQGAMPYVLVGWTQTDVEYGGLIAVPLMAAVDMPSKLSGWTFGGGIEMPIKGTPLSMAAEARWTQYQSKSIANVVDLQTDQLQAMVRLNWNFGGSTAASMPLK